MSKQMKLKFYGEQEVGGNTKDSKVITKHLKVYYGSHQNSNYSRFPVIRIGGGFMRNYFKIGQTIEIRLSEGHIEINALPME